MRSLASPSRATHARALLLATLALGPLSACSDGGLSDEAAREGADQDDDPRTTKPRGASPERDAGTKSPSATKDASTTRPSKPDVPDTKTPGTKTPDTKDADPVPPSSDDGPSERGDLCLEGSSNDYKAKGPYQVKQKDVTIEGLGPYTIFYPATMDKGCKHPIVAWGNGTGVGGSAIYAHWQQHAASWGLVVIASHNAIVGANKFLEGGIDYLLAENAGDGEFAGKLSTRAGVAGHSQGGIAATGAARHKNVQAEVCVEGGGLPPANVAFLCLTGTGDFLRAMCTSAFNTAKGPSFLADLQGADHISTPTLLGAITPQGAEFVRTYTAWFRCHLADDANACKLFRGDEAPICKQGAMFATCKGKNFQ